MPPQWRDPEGGVTEGDRNENKSQDMPGSLTPEGESTLFAERHQPILEIQTLIIANLYITSAMAKPSPACEPLIGTYHSPSQQIVQSVESRQV